MKITRKSLISGKTRTLEIAISEAQYNNYCRGDKFIQHALSHLTANDREFIMTGITEEEWNSVFVEFGDSPKVPI